MSDEPAPLKKRRRFARFVRTSCVLMALLAALVCLLPSILSTNAVRKYVLRKVSSVSPGSLEISDWSFGWLSGVTITGISFTDLKTLDLNVSEIALSRGLVHLLSKTIDFGELAVSEPRVTLMIPDTTARPTAPPQSGGPEPDARRGRDSQAKPGPARPSAFVCPDIRGRVKLTSGVLEIRVPSADMPYTLDQINAGIIVAGLNNPIECELSMRQKETGGSLTAKGSVKLLENGTFDPARLCANLVLSISHLDLAPFGAAAAACTDSPNITGELNCILQARADGMDSISASGRVDIARLCLSGGALGADKPSYDSVRLNFQVNRSGPNIRIPEFDFSSPLAAARVSGELAFAQPGSFPSGNLRANAHMSVARLAYDIPATLRLRKDLRLSDGVLKASASVQSADGKALFALDSSLRNVQTRKGTETKSVGSPIELKARLVVSPDGPQLESLSLSSAFISASGKGTPDNLHVAADADIAAALRELAKFVELPAVAAEGKIAVTLDTTASSNTNRLVRTGIEASGLSLTGLSPEPFVLKSLRADMEAHTGPSNSLRDIRVTIASAPLSGSISVPQFRHPDQAGRWPAVQGAVASLKGELSDAIAMAAGTGLLTNGLAGSGAWTADAKLDIADDVLSCRPASFAVTNLVLKMKGNEFREPCIALTADLMLPLESGSVTLSSARLRSNILSVDASGSLTDASSGRILHVEGSHVCDFALLSSLVSTLAGTSVKMAGKRPEQFKFDVSLAGRAPIDIFQTLNGASGLYVEQAKAFGLNIRDLTMQVTAKEASLNSTIQTQVNEGALKAMPHVEVDAGRLVLSLPDKSRVLDRVKLTDEMASELLALIHPIFRGCTVAGGYIGLTVNSTSVPLDEKMKTDMIVAGSIDLHDVKLVPAGLLKDVMDLARLKQETVSLDDQAISFDCRDGLVRTDPLVIKHEGYRLIFSGTVGTDGSLNYAAEMPVTEKMVDNPKYYPYVRDAVIKVPITGTVSHPGISSDAATSAVAGLVKQAAKNVIADEAGRLLKDIFGDKKK